METKEFIDLPEVATYLGVSLETVYRYIRSKENPLPSMKISRKRILVNKEELDEWIFNFRKDQEVK
jgi:excisionase family DNA binding protein